MFFYQLSYSVVEIVVGVMKLFLYNIWSTKVTERWIIFFALDSVFFCEFTNQMKQRVIKSDTLWPLVFHIQYSVIPLFEKHFEKIEVEIIESIILTLTCSCECPLSITLSEICVGAAHCIASTNAPKVTFTF